LKRRGRNISVIIICVIAFPFIGYEITQLKYATVLNPSPNYFMTVKGHIDPALVDRINLKWVVTYRNDNPKCQLTTSWIEGADADRNQSVSYKPTLSEKGDFKLQLPLDLYQPGYCKWVLQDISYSLKGLSDDFTYLNPNSPPTKESGSSNIVCSSLPSRTSCRQISSINFNNDNGIRLGNYKYYLNIREETDVKNN